ncbi:S9 family peptidase [Sphingomonas sp. G-3-2-10]|nr:S9 family peptidase [Sphingomonas sp. G-3-2-10]
MALRNLLRIALGALALATAPAAVAQKADPLAEAMALPHAGQLTGARDAGRFAWVETASGVRNIWIADKGQPARQVTRFTQDDGQPLYHVTLSRDGKQIAFVKGGDDEFADGSTLNAASLATAPKQQVWLIPADGAEPVLAGDGHSPVFSADGTKLAFTRRGEVWVREKGEAKRIAMLGGEVTRLQWSADGAQLLMVDNQNDYSFVTLIDVASAKVRQLGPGLGYSVEPVFAPDGKQVAFIQYLDPPAGAARDSGPYWSIRIADLATGSVRTLWKAPQGMGGRYAGTRMRNLWWSADGEIVFPWERSGYLHVYAINAAKGGEPRPLTQGSYEVETFILAPDNATLVFSANRLQPDKRNIWRTDPDGGDPVRITQGDGIESFPTFTGDGELAVIATDASHIAHPARVANGKLTPLGKAPALRSFVVPQAVTYKAADGVTVHAQLFRATGPGKHPALIYVHGGPRRQMLLGFHPMGYYSNAYVMNQHLAAQGYDVLSINYRSGTGYGREFRDAPEIARDGASEYRDVIAGGRWLAAQSHVDPARIGIWGGSWGGYLTALALARDSDLFAAGVDFHGVHTMLRPVPNNLSPDAQNAARQLQWSSSPMGAIGTWRSPVLLIHGDDDKSVDFGQSLILSRELAARRIPYEELVFPNDRHEFFLFSNWLESYRATADFLDRRLKSKGR